VAEGFEIRVYQNRVLGTKLLAKHWGSFAEGLKFGTNAFGGYGTCTFSLKFKTEQLLAYLNGYGSEPGYVTNRIRIIDPHGVCVYEGMIYALALHLGNETIARSADNLFNVVRADYSTAWFSNTQNQTYYTDDAASRALYGKKVKRLQLPGTYNPYTPAAATGQAQRFLNLHSTPQDPQPTTKGGSSSVIKLDVSCVGLATPGLEWRFAFSTLTASVDTAEIIKDMILPGPNAEGVGAAGRGRSGSNWVEPLNIKNYLVTHAVLTANVATLTLNNSHGYTIGDLVTVAGVSLNAVFNGQFTLTAIGSGTISYPLTHADIGGVNTTGTVNSTGTLAFAQDFLSTDTSHIANSGMAIERNGASGSARIDIVKHAAQFGSSNQKRMLFQVWSDVDPAAVPGVGMLSPQGVNAGKGVVYFQEMSEANPFSSNYSGYYSILGEPVYMDSRQRQIPAWRVRAGAWMTTLGNVSFATLVPQGGAHAIYKDPRCKFIESTMYDVDAGQLTITPMDYVGLEKYVGRFWALAG